jgi:hypothetical protein
MMRGFGRVSADEIGRLGYHGRRLFAIHRASRGREPDDPEGICKEFKHDLPAAIREARDQLEFDGEPRNRPLRQHELAAALGIHEDTLRSRMKQCKMLWTTLKRRPGGHVLTD